MNIFTSNMLMVMNIMSDILDVDKQVHCLSTLQRKANK